MRSLATAALGVLAAMLVACGGSREDVLTQSDALDIIGAPPPAPGQSSWSRDVRRQYSVDRLRAEFATVGDELARARFARGFEQTWLLEDGNRASAEARALVFHDAKGARDGFAPVQRLPRFIPSWFVPTPAEGLGEEAVFGSGEPGAGYVWRRENLVLSAWMYPIGGSGFDVRSALEAYARDVDERAGSR